MPTKETMLKIMEKHVGPVEMFGNDETVRGFAALSHDAEFKDGKFHPQLMVMNCQEFQGTGFVDAFKLSQMWDCQEDRDRIFSECKFHTSVSTWFRQRYQPKNVRTYSWTLPMRWPNFSPPVRLSTSKMQESSFWPKMFANTP